MSGTQGISGKIKLLRVNDGPNHSWGPPGDELKTEVIVQLDTAPDMAFGFDIKSEDPNLPARLAMLSVLRDAYIHNLTIHLNCQIDPGKKNGVLRRINLS